HVVARNQSKQRVGGLSMNAIERGGSVNVPESHDIGLGLQSGDCGFEQLVEDADSTGFHDEVGVAGAVQGTMNSVVRGGVDNDFSPGRIFDIAVLLALIGVGLVERDVVAARM